jgi:hypothetical protein
MVVTSVVREVDRRKLMHRRFITSVGALRAVIACNVGLLGLPPPAAAASRTFVAPLSGSQEVPAVDTNATGVAVFRLSKDGTELSYRLNVANIVDVTQAHIHLGPAGVNGPVVAWLYPSGPPAQLIPGRTDGVLATGTITAESLVGPLAGASLADLVAEMEAGNAYVNVHTSAHPAGEIRGQLR